MAQKYVLFSVLEEQFCMIQTNHIKKLTVFDKAFFVLFRVLASPSFPGDNAVIRPFFHREGANRFLDSIYTIYKWHIFRFLSTSGRALLDSGCSRLSRNRLCKYFLEYNRPEDSDTRRYRR